MAVHPAGNPGVAKYKLHLEVRFLLLPLSLLLINWEVRMAEKKFSKNCPICGAGPYTNPNELLAHVASKHPTWDE